MRALGVAFTLLLCSGVSVARGADRGTVAESAPLIESYEPNVVGYILGSYGS